MSAKTKTLIFGTLLIINGCFIWVNKGGSVYGQPLPPYFGVILIAFGLLVFLYSFKAQNTEKYICPKCEETAERIGTQKVHCPKCGTKMEPASGKE